MATQKQHLMTAESDRKNEYFENHISLTFRLIIQGCLAVVNEFQATVPGI